MSISREELDQAFKGFHQKWQKVAVRGKWEDVKLLSQHGTRMLRITRSLESGVTDQLDASQSADQEDENDEEALQPVKSTCQQGHVVTYDIVHSPSYQVPVLYLSVRYLDTARRPTIDEVYALLVEDAYKPQMQAVGVMGALSLTDHPASGLPVYFIHPCRTQEVMESLLSGKVASPERYLALWIGMIGVGVGLSIPVELAKVLEPSS